MGRRLNITEYRWTPTQYNPLGVSPSHDSHVSPGGLEWIVFDEAQIIPIVVLHLGSSLDVDSLGVLAGEGEGERGEREEGGRKRRLTALARKNLPYGFGPAGGRFVVEEVGEVSFHLSRDGGFREHVWLTRLCRERLTRMMWSGASTAPRC